MQQERVYDFPSYLVSDDGKVMVEDTGYVLRPQINQFGVAYVMLSNNRGRTSRSLALLVAEAFGLDRLNSMHDTPINLDGDRGNCRLDNLAMRPRWFASEFFRQLESDKMAFRTPLRDTLTGEEYPNSRALVHKFGLLEDEIFKAVINHTYVLPTYQVFERAY